MLLCSLTPSIVALLLALILALLGNLRGLLYIPMSAAMLVPALYNYGVCRTVPGGVIVLVIAITALVNVFVTQYTVADFYDKMPSKAEIKT